MPTLRLLVLRRTLLVLVALAVAAAAGCYTGPKPDLDPEAQGPAPSPTRASPPSSSEPVAAGGLPCDVARVLAESCTDCHGRPLREGAPVPLLTYEDLAAPSKSDPGRTVGAVAAERIKDMDRPMPPDDRLEAADVAILERWLGGGMPRGACTGGSSAADDAGTQADGSGSQPEDASSTDGGAAACTSNATWPAGASPSALMHPGKACIGCHALVGGPSFALAGTVYAGIAEPDECNGASGASLSVLVIDATGKTHTMPVNAAGNFARVTSLPLPYRAMVVDGTKVREMKTPQMDGDCNGCHTEKGSRAPGRVMAP